MSLSGDIFNIDGDERQAVFEELYFFKFGRLAHPGREAVRKETMEKIKIIKELGKEVTDFLAEHGGDAAKKALKTGSDAVIANMVNNLVAREVVKGTVKGAVDQFGRRGAVFAIEQGENMTAAQGAHAAVNGIKVAGKIGAFIPGISAAIGQPIAEKCTEFAGIENHHAKNCLDVGGAVAGGAGAGAIIGGLPGAAAGAVVGVGGWLIGKGIDAIVATFPGSSENWCYVKTGNVDGKICTGTYSANNTMYWKTYWNEYRGSNCDEYVMSAGQGREKSFQLTVWDRNNEVVTHLKNVYHRDLVHIGKKDNGQLCVAHGKGEKWESSAGSVDIHH